VERLLEFNDTILGQWRDISPISIIVDRIIEIFRPHEVRRYYMKTVETILDQTGIEFKQY